MLQLFLHALFIITDSQISCHPITLLDLTGVSHPYVCSLQNTTHAKTFRITQSLWYSTSDRMCSHNSVCIVQYSSDIQPRHRSSPDSYSYTTSCYFMLASSQRDTVGKFNYSGGGGKLDCVCVWGGVKWPGREVDHSPPSSAEVKEWVDLYLHSPNTHPWRGAQLKRRDNFTFTVIGIVTRRILYFYNAELLTKNCDNYLAVRNFTLRHIASNVFMLACLTMLNSILHVPRMQLLVD
jgi:hypothetical protein